jgi:hypothetical protein
LGNPLLQNFTFWRVFTELLENLKNEVKNQEEEKKVLWVEKLKVEEEKKSFKGFFKSGNYGYETTSYDTITQEKEVIEATKASALSFYFSLKILEEKTQSILCLGRFKEQGIKGVVEKNIKEHFKKLFGNKYRLTLNPIVPRSLVSKNLKSGDIKKIRLLKYKSSPNAEANLGQEERVEEKYIEIMASPFKKGGNFNIFKTKILEPLLEKIMESDVSSSLRYFSEFNELKEIYEISGLEEFEDLKIEISNNGKTRTLDFSHLHRFNAYYSLENSEIDILSGHTKFKNIDEFAEEVLKEILETMYGGNI